MTISFHPPGDPSTRGWGPGWPHGQTSKMVTVTLSNGTHFPQGMRAEIAHLFTLLCEETIRRGYMIHPGQCWGYENRPITGTTDQPSLHSWGLAGDINAPENPYHSSLITDMPFWMPTLWAAYGWRWGGTYPGNKDAMHYEFMGTPAEAAAMTAKAALAFAKPKPTKPPINPITEDDMFVYYAKQSEVDAHTKDPAHHPAAQGYQRVGSGRAKVSGWEAQARVKAGDRVGGAILVDADPFWALPVVP